MDATRRVKLNQNKYHFTEAVASDIAPGDENQPLQTVYQLSISEMGC